MLQTLKNYNSKCTVVVITTDKVYENKEQHVLYKESDSLGGYDPYSASKACTELVVNSFRNSFFNLAEFSKHQKAIATARAGNVIGGGDWSENRIIPDAARALTKNEKLFIRNPKAVRPWQHVLEPLFGYLLLAANLDNRVNEFSEPFNFGPNPDGHLTVDELAKIFINCWGYGEIAYPDTTESFHEANLLQLDISKAKEKLNWNPMLNAKEAILNTALWYKKADEEKAAFTFKQIENYYL